MNGELRNRASALSTRARDAARSWAGSACAATSGIHLARVEIHGGDLDGAEREVRQDLEFLHRMGENYYLSTMAALLAQVVREQGTDEEALDAVKTAEEANFDQRRCIASVLASDASPDPGSCRRFRVRQKRLARTAVELIRTTESPSLEAEALSELAYVLKIAGKLEEARAVTDEAIALIVPRAILSRRNAGALGCVPSPSAKKSGPFGPDSLVAHLVELEELEDAISVALEGPLKVSIELLRPPRHRLVLVMLSLRNARVLDRTSVLTHSDRVAIVRDLYRFDQSLWLYCQRINAQDESQKTRRASTVIDIRNFDIRPKAQ